MGEADNMQNKAYLFVTPSISALGGAERYMAGKAAWLTSNRWDVYIAGPCSRSPEVDYGTSRILDIRLFTIRPYTISASRRFQIVKDVVLDLKDYEEVYIESSTISYGFWGEYIASLLKAKHLIFHLSEDVPVLSVGETDFLHRLYNERRLYFIKKGIAQRAIGNTVDDSGVLVAYMPSAIQRTELSIPMPEKRGFRFGCISRLDKPFLLHALESIASFSSLHPDAAIEVVVVGGSTEGGAEEDELCRRLTELCGDRVKLILTGGLCPIPYELVSTFDFGFGKAGGAYQLTEWDVPTLCYSMDTDEPMGVLGFDFRVNPCRAEGDLADVGEILYEAVYGEKYKMRPLPMKLMPGQPKYEEHLRRFDGLTSPIKYALPISHNSIRESLKGALYCLLGLEKYRKLRRHLKEGR